jgi:hypothetical protein
MTKYSVTPKLLVRRAFQAICRLEWTYAARKKKMPKTSNFLVNHLTPHNPDCPLFQVLHAIVLFSDLISAFPFFDISYNSFFFHLPSATYDKSFEVSDVLWPKDWNGNHLIIPLCPRWCNMIINRFVSPLTPTPIIRFHPSSL